MAQVLLRSRPFNLASSKTRTILKLWRAYSLRMRPLNHKIKPQKHTPAFAGVSIMQPHGCIMVLPAHRYEIEVARLAKLPHLASASPSGLLQSTWLPSPALSPLLPLPRPHAAAACGCGFDAQRGPPRGQRPQQLRQQRWQLRLPRPFFPSWPKSFSMMNHKGANGQDGQDMYRNSIHEKSDWPAMMCYEWASGDLIPWQQQLQKPLEEENIRSLLGRNRVIQW